MSSLARRWLSAFTAALALGGALAAPAPGTKPQLSEDAAEAWPAVISQRYEKSPARRTHHHSPCVMQHVQTRDGPRWLMAVCARPISGGSHAEGALVDFYVLKPDGDRWSIEAQALHHASGGFGEPGQLRVLQVGPGWYGFALTDGYTGQGQTIGTLRLLAPIGKRVAEVAALNTGYDNSGSGACEKPPAPNAGMACRIIERSWRLQPGDGSGDVAYPIVIDESREARGRAQQRRWELRWDGPRQRYKLPAGFRQWLE